MTIPMDYPAAHSMDTDWFAVDAYSRVGIFQSYEAGAMPEQYGQIFGKQTWFYDFLHAVLKQRGANPNPCIHSLMSESSPILLRGKPITWDEAPSEVHCVVVRSNLPIRSPQAMKLTEGYFCEWRDGSKAHFREKFERGEYSHVWFDVNLAVLVGFFAYRHGDRWENWISGPYELIARPPHPLLAGQLPTEMRIHPATVLMAYDFATDELIQPVDTLPCSSWQDAYIATDLKTIRPVPPDDKLRFTDAEIKALEERGMIMGAPNEPPEF